ncbi:MAG: dihydroorotase [Synechococcaceae cyanobacterium]|nr:dihydroorotase [Synechococcaceae cyanobacterium]
MSSCLLRRVNLLQGPDSPPVRADVWIENGSLSRIEPLEGPSRQATGSPGTGAPPPAASDLPSITAERLWLGPSLVDPHSVLEDPLLGRAETLSSLAAAAASGGYGTLALLPWGASWRDRPERLGLRWDPPLRLRLWGSFSSEGADQDLAPHAEQLACGAIGLAGGDAMVRLDLLERGLRLGEMGERPVLLAPRDAALTQQGFVRERIEAIRAGWPLDPPLSELLPLQQLLCLAQALPQRSLRLMNLSTLEAVHALGALQAPPMASVCWWHLVADSGRLDPADEGWRVVPSLGGPDDREALISALAAGTLSAVSVQHVPLDAEERLLPLDQRRPGLAGHGLVLPLLWQELVERRGWSAQQLWQVLCWGPSTFLGEEPERLTGGSRRWLLFDPERRWRWDRSRCRSLAANQPFWQEELRGAVLASGLSAARGWAWDLPGIPEC